LWRALIKTYWHVIVDSSSEYVRGTIFVQMLIHAVTAERAIAAIWIRCNEVSITRHKRESDHLGKASLARNTLKAFFVSIYNGGLPGVTTGIEVAGRDDESGWRAAVWTLLVYMGERNIIGYVVLPAPVPNTLYEMNQRKRVKEHARGVTH
jgi:hypothetical protein